METLFWLLCKDFTRSRGRGAGAAGRVRSGAKGPVPVRRAAGVERPDGAQTSGVAYACRVVVSPPTAPAPAAPPPSESVR